MTPHTPENSIEKFLSGGGELGQLMRSTDWEKTSLGNVANWPKSLKTCVRIVLTSRQPMFVWWGKDLINIYNDAYRSIVGGKHPWSLGKPAKEVWYEIWDQILPRVETAIRTNEGTYDESLLLIMERNGYPEETYYTFSYSPVPGDDGETAGIICANTDDTQRIIGERQLRTLKDLGKIIPDCKSNDEVYEKTIQVIKKNQQDFPFAVIYQVESNGKYARLSGATTDDLPTSIVPELIDIESGERHYISRSYNLNSIEIEEDLVQKYGKLPSGVWQKSPDKSLIIPITQSGQKHPHAFLKIGLNPYRKADEKYIGFFHLVADQIASGIASVNAYEAERRRAEALIEIDSAKTIFFSNISHEFRTPLTLMLGPLEELLNKENGKLLPEHRDSIESTHRNAMRLLRLVNTLLDFSRIEAGRMQAQYAPIDISSFTKDIASSFQSAIESAGLQYEIECSDINGTTYVDREMWEKIVLNLLSNAFKYTLTGKIKLCLLQDGNNVVLKISDTGVGIPEEELPFMFKRFHRVKNTPGRTHEGTGIGLSLVKELVKLHGGNIEVESIVSSGSTFTVSIPTGKVHLPEANVSDEVNMKTDALLTDMYVKEAISLAQESIEKEDWETSLTEDSSGTTTESNTGRAKLLIVDDNADMREYLKRLTGKYFEVVVAENGEKAMNIVAANRPDIIVSDIMMPVMDGIELLHAIKNNPVTARIPVILLSARAGEEAKIEGYEVGADDYLVKPFSSKELLARVRSQLRIVKMYREVEDSEARFRTVANTAPVMVWMQDEDQRFNFVNTGWRDFTGCNDGIDLNDGWKDYVHKDDFNVLQAAYKTAYKDANGFEIEYRLKRNDGVYRWVLDRGVPRFAASGQLLGFIGSCIDIHERKAVNEELEKRVAERTNELYNKNHELQQQKEFVETILDSSVDVIAVLDKDLHYVALNKKAEELYNFNGAIIGKHILNAFPQIKQSGMYDDLLLALKGEIIHRPNYNSFLKRNFENFYIPLKDSNGDVHEILLIGHDITELMNASEELKQTNEALVKINNELEQFAYVSSHDLQEPLRKIQTFSDLLIHNVNDKQFDAKRYLEKINASAGRMTTLIKDLLTYSKLSKVNEQFVETDLNYILENVINDFEVVISQKNAVIRSPLLPVIKAVPVQMNQLFYNLIGNALKFVELNPVIDISFDTVPGKKLKDHAHLNHDRSYLQLNFRDNGIGFDQKYADKIFTVFQRLNNKDQYNGTGIGLAVCKKIAETHGGHISAESEPGKGASFTIYLPNGQ